MAAVQGRIGHGNADGDAPIKIGGVANAAAPDDVTEGDRVNASFTLDGKLRVEADSLALPAGTNNIGSVDIDSMPAAARTTDTVSVALATDKVMDNLTEVTPEFFYEAVAASDTDEELEELTASKKIRVLSLYVQAGGTATDVTFESSTTTPKFKVTAGINGGCVLPFNPVGWFETASGESLTVTTGAGSTVQIAGTFIKV